MNTVKFTTGQIKRAELEAHHDLFATLFGEQFDTNFVPGVGNVNARVVFVGEAPGAQEDAQRVPFVGESGKLLNAGLKRAGLRRKDVWITNFMKYRPPANRDPQGDEIPVCMNLLRTELKIINPRIVVTLGRFSTNLFWEQPHMATLAGQVWVRRGFTVVPMYHPASVLYGGYDRDEWLGHFESLADCLAQPITAVEGSRRKLRPARKTLGVHQDTPKPLRAGSKPLRRAQ